MRKIIVISIIILGIIAMGVGVYFAWKKTKSILTPPPIIDQQPTTDDQQPTTDGQRPTTDGQRPTTDDQRLPILTEKKLKIISDQAIFDYWVYQSSIFYLNQDGLIFKVKEEGEDEIIASGSIENLQAVKSSSDGKRIVIKSGDLALPKFTIFNSESGVFELLPENITAIDFSPDAQKIAYLERISGNLIIKDLIGAKPKTVKVLSFNQKDFDLDWISAEKIVLVPKSSAFYQTSAWLIDIKKKTLTPLGAEINGLMIEWSSDGKMGLQFSSQPRGREGRLNLINEQGLIQADLNFVTLPNKCLISVPKIYCAVPKSIPTKTVLPDDYLKRAVYFRDALYQIDITQNSLSEIFTETEPAIDAVRLGLLDNKLLFINRYDNKLYSLKL